MVDRSLRNGHAHKETREGLDPLDDDPQRVVDGRSPRPLRRIRRWLWIAVAVAVPVGVAANRFAQVTESGVVIAASSLIGRPAPPLAGTDVMSGRRFRLATGRWTVVTFFATWCVPCRKEQPELVRFVATHTKSGDVGLLSVIYQDDAGAVKAFERTHGGTWPAAADPGGVIASAYEVNAVPQSFVIASSGVVVASVLGGVKAVRLDLIITSHPAKVR